MSDNPEDFLGQLRLSRQIRSSWQVAVIGLAVTIGLSLLIPAHIVNDTGWLNATPVLLGVVISGLTLLNVFELLGGSSERGGTSTLVHEALGALAGFGSGWTVLGAYTALAAALLRASGAQLAQFFSIAGPVGVLLGLAAFVFILLINLFHLLPRRASLTPVLSLLLLALGIMLLGALPQLHPPSSALPAPGQLLRAVAWSMTLFAGLETVLSSRRRILRPTRQLPRGLLILLVVSGLMLGIFTVLAPKLTGFEANMGAQVLLQAIIESSWTPGWATVFVEISVLIIAANACMMAAARQMYTLTRDGALPSSLTRVGRPFQLPPRIFLLLSLAIIPLTLLAPVDWLLDIGAGLFILQAGWVNLAAVRSRRSEPDRRRTIVVPFYPLVPIVALALCLGLVIALPLAGQLGSLAWLLIGGLLLVSYARTRLLEAQHGVLVFGREPEPEKPDGAYRILVPLSTGVERQFVLQLASALAHQTGGQLIPLQVIQIADPLAMQEGRRLAEERNTLFQWSTREAERRGIETYPITRLASSVAKGIQDTAYEEECDLILLSWPVGSAREGTRMGRVLDPVIRSAPCDVAVVAFHPDRLAEQLKEVDHSESSVLDIKRVVVTTAGGPHAPLAARLALLLAREFEATTRAVYVTLPEASQAELTEGQRRIATTIERLRELMVSLPSVSGAPTHGDEIPIESQIVTAPSIVEGIVAAGSGGDLVFIGASEESLIDQVLFGTLPEQVASECSSPVVMVKSYRGLPRFWLQRLWDGLFSSLPTVTQPEQVEIYKRVRRDSRPDTDFFVMMGLAAIIATYGLLQGSTAVIIGAMLVAPLFTPILATSLAIVQGDIRLLRLAAEAAVKGIVLAIGLALVLTVLTPLRNVTHEIAIRTSPNLFDLAVALASGAAGAYAVARKDVATSLPGVAIAAALVPPLCVIGIGLALNNGDVTWGGTLLFTTNLIAITLAGAVTLMLLGFRPAPGAQRAARLRLGLITSLVLLTLITVPLALVFIDSVRSSTTEQTINRTLAAEFDGREGVEVVEFEFSDRGASLQIDLTVNASAPIDEALARDVQDRLRQALNRPVALTLISVPIVELRLPASE